MPFLNTFLENMNIFISRKDFFFKKRKFYFTSKDSLSMFVLFADDTNIFVSGKTYNKAAEKANEILDTVSKYTSANKLHVNYDKTCMMHFMSKRQQVDINSNFRKIVIEIDGNEIEEVSETKFLGVVIDNKLSWEPHVNALTKKLQCCTGQLNRIYSFVPAEMYKSLYHTLFESHLSYGITVWGGISIPKLQPLFFAQKHCIRILFGDREAYREKFKTCVRVRPYNSQKLGREFYEKEHTKPLFNKHEIMTVQNIYNYHMLNGTYKILKMRIPIALYSCFDLSNRKETLLRAPKCQSSSFVCRASSLWNIFLNSPEGYLAKSFSMGIAFIKSKIKEIILRRQNMGVISEWHYEINFRLH